MLDKECQPLTMCIIHKGFRGFRASSIASNLGGNLIGLKPAIPYEIIHSTLASILEFLISGFYTPKKKFCFVILEKGNKKGIKKAKLKF